MALYQALANFCSNRKEFANSEHRTTLQKEWGKYQKIYRNYLKDGYTGKAKISIPHTFGHAFRLVSGIMQNIRRNPDIVKFIPEPKHDAVTPQAVMASDAMQQAAQYYTRRARLLREISEWELEAICMGTSFMKTTWRYEESETTEFEIDELTGEPIESEPEVLYDGLEFEHRPLSAIYVDPKSFHHRQSVDEMEYLIDQRYMSFEELFADKRYFNKSEVLSSRRARKSASRPEDEFIPQSVDEVFGSGYTGVESRDQDSDQVLVEEYWGRVPRALMGKGFKNKDSYANVDLKDFVSGHVIMAEGVVVFFEDNPYPKGRIPYDVIRCYPAPNQFYGIGVPELLKPLQRAINAITNQRIDNVMLALNTMFAYRRGMVDPRHAVSKPGGLIPVRGPISESIMPLPIKDVTQSSYNEHQLYDTMSQKYSGLADIFFGHTATKRQSATEPSLQTEMGAGMMEEIVAEQVEDGFVPLMEKVRDYIQAFGTEPLPVIISGETTVVTPEQLSGDFVLVPTVGNQMFSKQQELSKALMLLQTTASLMPVITQTEGVQVRLSKILEKVYEIAGWRDYSAIVTGNPQEGAAQGQAVQGEDGTALGPGNSGGAGGNPSAIGPGFQGVPGIEDFIM